MQIQPAPDDNTDNPAEVPIKTEVKPASPEEQRVAADIVRRLKWPVVQELFEALCSATTTTGCELVVLRDPPADANHACRYEVLFILRADIDPCYGNMYDSPGSIRRGQESDQAIIDRILSIELDGVETTAIYHVLYNLFQPKRGQELTKLHVTLVRGEYKPKPGREWFPLDRPPINTLDHHQVMARQILEWLVDHDLINGD